ncbi:MAG: hypothetical protein KJ065_02555 [Anaerolineae bacterium]|nr:hypothetical protein [Anaerolineae bacterium]
MSVEFYDVKLRSKVKIDDKKISKTTFEGANGSVRYGIRGETADGRMLTKFVSKDDWDKMSYPVVKSAKKAAKKEPKKEAAPKKAAAKTVKKEAPKKEAPKKKAPAKKK